MLREKVLEVWKGFKEKYLKELDLIDQMGTGLGHMIFFNTYDLDKTPCQAMKELKRRLPSITQECQELGNKFISGKFNGLDFRVGCTYMVYIRMPSVYEKIIEYYDETESKLNLIKTEANRQELKRLKECRYIGDTITDLRTDLAIARESEQWWKSKFNSLKNLINNLNDDSGPNFGPTIEEVE